MILGLGIDLCEVSRMEAECGDTGGGFVQSVFTSGEIGYCGSKRYPAQHFAARFAAKEACIKALAAAGGSGAFWQDIQIAKEAAGGPILRLTGRALELAEGMGVRRCHVSLTHTGEMAAAVVVLED